MTNRIGLCMFGALIFISPLQTDAAPQDEMWARLQAVAKYYQQLPREQQQTLLSQFVEPAYREPMDSLLLTSPEALYKASERYRVPAYLVGRYPSLQSNKNLRAYNFSARIRNIYRYKVR